MTVRIDVLDDHVDITFDGWDRIWALRSSLRLPYSIITSARVAPFDEVRADMGWRVGGSYVPRLVAAGNYQVKGRPGALQVWCVRRDRELLVIDTCIDSPARVVLQTPDRHDLAWLIGERIPPR